MPRIDSSTISTAEYDPESQELRVAFHSGGTYVYQDVPKEKYQAFMMSSSKGSFLHNNIKGSHEYEKGNDKG